MIRGKVRLIVTAAAISGLAASAVVASAAKSADINHGQLLAATGGFPQDETVACARCHQLDGTGDSSGAFPRLADQSAWYLYKTLQDYASGLRPSEIMQPIARSLTSTDMQDLAAYFASLEDAPYPAKPDVDPQTLQLGGALVAAGDPEHGVPACSNCHGADGVGSPPIYPFIAGQYAPYLENQLQLWKHGRRQGDPLGVMQAVAKTMSGEQIHAVSLYLASVRSRQITPHEPAYLSFQNVQPAGPGTASPQGHLGALSIHSGGPGGTPSETSETQSGNQGNR